MEPSLQHTDRHHATDSLVEEHIPLARRLAHRYAGKGEALEDLIQVAMVGLVNAARRYDPERGTDFARFAVPTILGELRRHFRDSCWAVRVPRGLQELALRVQSTAEVVSREQGRSPTVREIAAALEVSEDEVLEALEAGSAYSATSLDAPAAKDDPSGPTLADQLGDDEPTFDTVEAREATKQALSQLPERERRVLTLRYFGDRTQREIAEELNISQMHVSRLLARTLTQLHDHLVDEVDLPESWSAVREPDRLVSSR
jgi:RNA polymerase sigma-B factor